MLAQSAIIFLLLPIDSPLNLLRMQTSLSPNEFQTFLFNWGPETVALFLRHYWVDFFYPLIYSSFLYLLLVKLKSRFFILPVLAGALDILENTCQLAIIHEAAPAGSVIFFIGATSAILKWVLVMVTGALVIYSLGLALARR